MKVSSNAEKMLFNTVKINTFTSNGQEGAGTGFFFSIDRDGTKYRFIVTNKHVVDGSHKAFIRFHSNNAGQPVLGNSIDVEFFNDIWKDMWVGHPDPKIDIAVASFDPIQKTMTANNLSPYLTAINPRNVPTAAQLAELDVIEDITFVGYPNGLWDSKNVLPVMRRGTTATPPQVDFEGEPIFLIDASVFGGSSGSPVFISQNGTFADKKGDIHLGSRFYFLGVVAEVFCKTDHNEIISVSIPTALKTVAVQEQMIDIGLVYKASTVLEAIEHFYNLKIKPLIADK